MKKRSEQETKEANNAELPRGITNEAISEALAIWQPYSKEKLTEADAVEMILNVRRLAGVVRRAYQARQLDAIQKKPCARAA